MSGFTLPLTECEFEIVSTAIANYYRQRKAELFCDQLRIIGKSLAGPPPPRFPFGFIDVGRQ